MKKEIYKYTGILAFGILIGFKIIPSNLLELLLIIFSLNILFDAVKNNLSLVINKLSYLLLLEPYTKAYLLELPYLFIQYLIITIYIFYQFNNSKKLKNIYPWLIFFTITILFEFLNIFRTIDFRYTRSVLINSSTLFAFILLGRQYLLSDNNLYKLLKNISYAGIMLTGIIAVAHFQGSIKYNTESNFESSNGMAPVQLSFYLSFTIVVTYIIYLKYNLSKNIILYFSIITLELIIMILTFSRGGLYFFGLMFILLNIENIRKIKLKYYNILGFLILVPISYFIYNFTVNQTEGAVLKRYNEEGVSNRDILVSVGIDIYEDNPLFGIGTGNFNNVANDRKYFGQVSGAHNEYIRILAEHGILCFIFYLLFFISLSFHVWYNKNNITYFIIPIVMILAFNFGSIHNGLKLSLQSFTLFIAIAYLNTSNLQLKSNK